MPPKEVTITGDVTASLEIYFNNNAYSQVAILVDENSKVNCLPIIRDGLQKAHIIEIKSGEEHKTLDTCSKIWSELTDLDFDRHGLLINLGGGVIGDMGGFCASTYKRGITFCNIPTTLLAQVDASVGGKLGIDFKGFKNHIGVFNFPNHVFIDTVFLKTLPERELRSGFAEVVKHSLIADNNYWQILNKGGLKDQNWDEIVSHSVNIKGKVVEEDPSEKGLRKILNFGHTIGHALETYFLNKGDENKKLLHGEAIAAGMICESYLSESFMNLTAADSFSIEKYINSIFERVLIQDEDIPQILTLIGQDKKNKNGIINFSLLKSIGNCSFDVSVDANEMEAALTRYQNAK